MAILATRWHVSPRSGQTVLSQIIAAAIGRGWAFYTLSLTITVVLALAANTSFGGLPVLASLIARDNYLPHLLALRDERQVFGFGIWALAASSAALLLAVRGNTLALIPMFAIGVFTGFTLSQAGLVRHWHRSRPPHWRRRVIINGTGAAVTGAATLVFIVTKFSAGAWVVLLAAPALMYLFVRVRRYYDRAARLLGEGRIPDPPRPQPTIVVVPVTGLSRLTQQAIAHALSMSTQVIAVHVVVEGDDNTKREPDLQARWAQWHPGVPLRILHTEYASIARPIVGLIDELRHQSDRQIVVLIPVVRPDRISEDFLHDHQDLALTKALRPCTDVIVAKVPIALSTD